MKYQINTSISPQCETHSGNPMEVFSILLQQRQHIAAVLIGLGQCALGGLGEDVALGVLRQFLNGRIVIISANIVFAHSICKQSSKSLNARFSKAVFNFLVSICSI